VGLLAVDIGVWVVPLAWWTLNGVRRHIVNGTVPDDALP
jgi:hypothetical protein